MVLGSTYRYGSRSDLVVRTTSAARARIRGAPPIRVAAIITVSTPASSRLTASTLIFCPDACPPRLKSWSNIGEALSHCGRTPIAIRVPAGNACQNGVSAGRSVGLTGVRSCGTAGGAALRTEGVMLGVSGHAGLIPLPSYIDLFRVYKSHCSLEGSLAHEHLRLMSQSMEPGRQFCAKAPTARKPIEIPQKTGTRKYIG